MRDLTGAPSFEYEIGAELMDQEYENIVKALQSEYLVYATVKHKDENVDQLRSVGLVPFSAYEILSEKQVANNEGNELKLMKMRSPARLSSEDIKYQGVAASDQWSSELEPLNEMEFWMSFEEFCNYFESYAISETVKSVGVVPNELISIELPRNDQQILGNQ